MMFKIISKKRYEKLIYERSNYMEKAAMLEEAVKAANKRNKELKIKIHDCDEFCVGCKHRVKNDDIYNIVYGGGIKRYVCDLNRTCEDYEAEYALSGRAIENLIEAETKRKERMREIKADTIKEFLNEIKKTIIGVDVDYTDADGCADRCTEAVPVEWIKKVELKFGEAESDG